jgi:hypothetical protein
MRTYKETRVRLTPKAGALPAHTRAAVLISLSKVRGFLQIRADQGSLLNICNNTSTQGSRAGDLRLGGDGSILEYKRSFDAPFGKSD